MKFLNFKPLCVQCRLHHLKSHTKGAKEKSIYSETVLWSPRKLSELLIVETVKGHTELMKKQFQVMADLKDKWNAEQEEMK